MTPAARLSAAIEVLADIEARRRPAADALKDWGLSHRFAGSGDRAAIAGLVYDALRRRAASAYVMGQALGEASPRAVMLGMLRLERKLDGDAIAALANGGRFAPSPLSDDERARLETNGTEPRALWESLEQLNLGRLRIAAKGFVREGADLRRVGEDVQRRDGMFMIVQVAALRRSTCSMAALHDDISAGSARHLASTSTIAFPTRCPA